jgi:hypothetical protein
VISVITNKPADIAKKLLLLNTREVSRVIVPPRGLTPKA